MSSEHASLPFSLGGVALFGVALFGVALFGGGRWSRVLLPVIRGLLDENTTIVWVTEHGYDRAKIWLQEKGIKRVIVQSRLEQDVSEIGGVAINAAVVATSPVVHGGQVRRMLELGIPTFCEKPFTLDFDEAGQLEQLSAAKGCALGIDLEMHFASFVEDFVARISDRVIREISIDWIDPWSETRYGETKHGDVYTSIVHDMWPHCWSLLRKLRPQRAVGAVTSIEEVRYQPSSGQVDILVLFDDVIAKVVLSRRGGSRVRRVTVNGGEAILDFSVEPGLTEIGGVALTNVWRGARPLSRSLSSFFEVVLDPSRAANWALSATACLDSVKSAQAIGNRLRSLQEAMLNDLRREGVKLVRDSDRNLIVDLLLPKYAALGHRWPAITKQEQLAFVKYVCETEKMRCH